MLKLAAVFRGVWPLSSEADLLESRAAPLEEFTASTNMYFCFDSKTLHAVTDRDEGRKEVY